VAAVYETWLAKRTLAVAEGTLLNYAAHWKRLEPAFGSRDPERITHLDVQAWVSAQDLSAVACRIYLGTLRQVLDYAGVNPTRSETSASTCPWPMSRKRRRLRTPTRSPSWNG
jgi:hypothetical protein